MLIVAGLALVLVVAAVLISQSGSEESGDLSGDAAAIGDLLEGVEQDRFSVGDPQAPLSMVEYGDLQCPFCADAATATIPELVSEYVTAGELRITFHPVSFIGEDSVEAAEMAAAAALQDRGFAFVELFYEQQGIENSGYVDEAFLRSIGEQVEGLDVEQALADRDSPAVERLLAKAEASARRDRVESTPTFLIAAGGEPAERIELAPDDVDGFKAEIERRLGG
jgi:protein-disulfide isomerase